MLKSCLKYELRGFIFMWKSCLKMSSEDSIIYFVSLKRAQRIFSYENYNRVPNQKASTKLGAKITMIIHVIYYGYL